MGRKFYTLFSALMISSMSFAVASEPAPTAVPHDTAKAKAVIDGPRTPEPQKIIVDKEPEVISCPPPAFPDQARMNATQGTVIVQFKVDTDGKVSDVTILKERPPNLGFAEAAKAAVLQWKFKPAILNEKPVATYVTQPVRFRLK